MGKILVGGLFALAGLGAMQALIFGVILNQLEVPAEPTIALVVMGALIGVVVGIWTFNIVSRFGSHR